MATVRRHLYGEHPRQAVFTVVAVGIATVTILAPFGVLPIGLSGLLGESVFAAVFGLVPGLAGAICGRYRLGLPAAVASGAAPGVTFYLVVAIGAALDVGSFGGGDSPAGPLALVLTAPGLVAATVGFAIAVATTRLRA